ncbi:pyruvate dehydrogenase E1 component subunit alpha type I, mitochondrial-like [Ostrea edulis]|uniref:pyruvate dehydrogenase E1 component subunit alpha type I, mitochondrial-like n=1 Tax=Ostrea edulis TaxID=37623 RepID=UPI0024AFF5FC|nr:pyruvate dehydrogenase E1 component subunit alpha type I, mitochondrial-like [Ostrea edulis]
MGSDCSSAKLSAFRSENHGSFGYDHLLIDFIVKVDGMDVLAVREALRFARDHALNSGPILIEAISYRYSGHRVGEEAMSDSAKEDLGVIRLTKDPIDTFKKKILDKRLTDIDELKRIDEAVRVQVKTVAEKVKMDQELPLHSIDEDVYQTIQVI